MDREIRPIQFIKLPVGWGKTDIGFEKVFDDKRKISLWWDLEKFRLKAAYEKYIDGKRYVAGPFEIDSLDARKVFAQAEQMGEALF